MQLPTQVKKYLPTVYYPNVERKEFASWIAEQICSTNLFTTQNVGGMNYLVNEVVPNKQFDESQLKVGEALIWAKLESFSDHDYLFTVLRFGLGNKKISFSQKELFRMFGMLKMKAAEKVESKIKNAIRRALRESEIQLVSVDAGAPVVPKEKYIGMRITVKDETSTYYKKKGIVLSSVLNEQFVIQIDSEELSFHRDQLLIRRNGYRPAERNIEHKEKIRIKKIIARKGFRL